MIERRYYEVCVIREDDVSYFTEPKSLEKLYRPLFEEKKPVNFSVIPNISAKIKVPENNFYRTSEHLDYDPMIPPKYRGIDKNFLVSENKGLLDYIKSYDSCEVAQHGFSHELIRGESEFANSNVSEIQRKLDLGKDILRNCFRSEISFFVPPWDTLSWEAMSSLQSRYVGLSLFRLNPSWIGKNYWFSYLKKRLFRRNYMFCGNMTVVEHPGYLLTRFKDPESVYYNVLKAISKEKIVVLVNHHWEYFFDWNGLNSPSLILGRKL